ncbi:MAG: MBL fold metallo-hydrolase [Deltaproteobacteria bacterium]|nr:MBL fold metallo-hydrolase [Deltaproteobacteria bacterium]
MRIKEPGWVTERILFLGRNESCIYLLRGENEDMLIGGGMAYIVPTVLDQFSAFGVDESRIKHLLILHAHFDHCGAVPFFKRRWPQMSIWASYPAQSILMAPKAVVSISNFNELATAQFGDTQATSKLDLSFPGVVVDRPVKEGDIIDLGGDISVTIVDAPGHSTCSIAAWVPAEKALFGSDGGGVPGEDRIFPAGTSNYTQYQETLQRMKQFPVEIFLAEHFGAMTGQDGLTYLDRSIDSAIEFRAAMEASFRKTGDVKESAAELTDSLIGQGLVFMPRIILEPMLFRMVAHIAENLR